VTHDASERGRRVSQHPPFVDCHRLGFAGTRFGGGSTAFVFSLVVSTVTGLVDGILTYALPKAWRAALSAIVGATIAVGLIVIWAGMVGPLQLQELLQSPQSLLPFAIIGALTTGACSLLSHNYRRSKA
jgi:hypothetical protein